MIVVNPVFKLFFKLAFCLISLKSSSKGVTGTHGGRASITKRRDTMVCNSECVRLGFDEFIVDFQGFAHRSNGNSLVTYESFCFVFL